MNEIQNKTNISSEKLEDIFKLLPYPVSIWKKVENDFILIVYNTAAEDITEGKIERYLGIKASELYKNQPEILGDLNRCVDEKTKISREMKYILKTTRIEKIFDVTYQFIPPDLIMVLTEDITERKRTEQELKESEERFRIIVEKAGIAFALFDLEGKGIMVNNSALKLTGYTREEFLRLNAADIALEIIPMKHRKKYSEKLAVGEYVEVIGMHKRKDGSVFPAETTLIKIKLKNQLIIAAFVQDISKRKKLVQESTISEEMYRLISENTNDLISINDHKGMFLYCNEAYERILGYSPEELIGTSVFKLIHPEDLNIILQNYKNTRQKEFVKNEVRVKCKNKSYKWMEYVGRGIFNKHNNLIKAIGISRDITLRKEVEQKLKKSEKKYREAYNRAEFYKDLFVHDMNNILQVILSSNHLSLTYLNDRENRKNIEEMLRMIEKQVERGANLIANIRKLSQLEEAEIPTHPTEVFAILSKVRENIIEIFHNKEVSIKTERSNGKIIVLANELLKDVFENILNNAIHHNINPNIEILIKISREQKKGINYCKMEFIDNGRGILNEMKGEIFKRDYREEQKGKGMGLGLSLVKIIIESYNGEIWVEDRVQGNYSKGSNFIVLIPEGE